MTPDFALSLSFDGITLLRRMPEGWARIDSAALDSADLDAAMARLLGRATAIDPQGDRVLLLLPNEQVRYVELPDPGRNRAEAARRALDGATPYAVEELAIDFSVKRKTLLVAAVARETLDEAESFATQNGFRPAGAVATAPEDAFNGCVWFGRATAWTGRRPTRPDTPIIEIAATDAAFHPAAPDDARPAGQGTTQGAAQGTTQRSARTDGKTAGATPAADGFAAGTPDAQTAGRPEAERPATDGLATDGQASDPADKGRDAPGPGTVGANTLAGAVGADTRAGAVGAEALAGTVDRQSDAATEPDPAFASPKAGTAPRSAAPGPTSPDSPAADPPATATAAPTETPAPRFASRRDKPDDSGGAGSLPTEERRRFMPVPPQTVQAAAAVPEKDPTRGPETADDTGDEAARDAAARESALRKSAPRDSAADRPAANPAPARPAEPARPALSAKAPGAAPKPAPRTGAASKPGAPRFPRGAALPVDPPPHARAAGSSAGQDAGQTSKSPAFGPRQAPEGDVARPLGDTAATPSIRPEERARLLARMRPESDDAPGSKRPTAPARTALDLDAERERMTVFGERGRVRPRGAPPWLGVALTGALIAALVGVGAFAVMRPGSDVTPIALLDGGQDAAPGAAATDTAGDAQPTARPQARSDAGSEPGSDTAARLQPAAPLAGQAPAIASTEDPAASGGRSVEDTLALLQTPDAGAQDDPAPAPEAQSGTDLPASPETATGNTEADGVAPPQITARSGPLSPEEAAATYAATGIWQRAPNAPDEPPAGSVDRIYTATTDASVTLEPRARLSDAPRVENAALPEAPGLPPPPGLTFDFDERGLIRATPDGALSPEGLRIFAGRPAVVPPLRSAVLPGPVTDAPPLDTFNDIRPAARPPEIAPDLAPDSEPEAGSAASDAEEPIGAGAAQSGAAGSETAGPGTADDAALADPGEPALADPEMARFAALRPIVRPFAPPDPAAADPTAADPAAADPPFDATPQAVAVSLTPNARPAAIAAAAAAAIAARQAPAPSSAPQAAPAAPRAAGLPRTVAPDIPSTAEVARAATIPNGVQLGRAALFGVYGSSESRRALVRLPNGRYSKVQVGDDLDGGRVVAISADALRYQKSGRTITLEMPQG